MDFTQEEITSLKGILADNAKKTAEESRMALVIQRDDELEAKLKVIADANKTKLDELAENIETCRMAWLDCCRLCDHASVSDQVDEAAKAVASQDMEETKKAYDAAFSARQDLLEQIAVEAKAVTADHLKTYAADYADPT
jgi:hypothetical protein